MKLLGWPRWVICAAAAAASAISKADFGAKTMIGPLVWSVTYGALIQARRNITETYVAFRPMVFDGVCMLYCMCWGLAPVRDLWTLIF